MHDLERIRSALSYIPANNDRDFWARIGMAIKSELGDVGFDLFEDWSQSADHFSAKDVRDTWKSIKGSSGSKSVGLGTLIWEAKNRGWVDDTKYEPPSKEELERRRKERARRDAEAAAELAAVQEAAAEFAQSLWDKGREADDHPYLQRKGVKAHGLRVGSWYRLDETTGELVQVTNNGLYVPMLDRNKKIHSLQCISSKPGGDKRYLKDGAKKGYFFPIGAAPKFDAGNPIFVLGEGYATCASAHEASGHLVLTCFDASNLEAVAAAIRARNAGAIIIFLADNDDARIDERVDEACAKGAEIVEWTTSYGHRAARMRKDTVDWVIDNVGVVAASKAAIAVGGLIAVPPPGDANDLHLDAGLDAVAEVIAGAAPYVEPVAAPEPEFVPAGEMPEPLPYDDIDAEPDAEHKLAPVVHTVAPDLDEEGDELTNNGYFAILGYNQDDYYFFHHQKKQVVTRRRGDFSDIGLIELADINFWETYFPAGKGNKGGVDKIAAAAWIFGVAHARGIYDTTKVRGRGAWQDRNRYVFHHGDRLTVDGQATDLTKIRSAYVYPMSTRMPKPAPVAMTAEEGAQMLDTADMVRWSRPASAALMAGWVFLAPICGALKWRPHIWITGEAGTGKSTIQSDFCQAPVAGIGKYFAGGSSTEPGIRQQLESDALPVLIDEFEPNDERDRQRISSVLTMIRQSSSESGAETAKGTVSGDGMRYHIRSMFCVASINTMLDKESDDSRLTKLVIRPARKGDNDTWPELEERLHKMKTDEDLPGRLLARALQMLPVVLETVKAFTKAAGKHFGKQRIGDQLGTLMAGAWCLMRDQAATEAEASAMIQSYDWAEHHDASGSNDPTKALGSVLEAKIRVNGIDHSVFELVAAAAGSKEEGAGLDMNISHDALKRNGMRIERDREIGRDYLLFASSSTSLRDLVAKTAYSTDLRGQLLRIDGANTWNNKTIKFSGTASKVAAIPLASIIGDPDDEPPV